MLNAGKFDRGIFTYEDVADQLVADMASGDLKDYDVDYVMDLATDHYRLDEESYLVLYNLMIKKLGY